MRKAFFIGCNALGDTLCSTPALHAFRKANPHTLITYIVHNAPYCRVLDDNPDVDLIIYNERLWMRGMKAFSMEWFHSLPIDLVEPGTLYHFDMNAVCSRAKNFHEHIAVGFSKLLGIQIESVRPVVNITDNDRRTARLFVKRPYVVFSRHSNANPRLSHGSRAKDWPAERWDAIAVHLHSRGFDVIAVGAEADPRPPCPFARTLYGLPIKVVAALLESAACIVTLENGIAHLSAAVDAPLVELYSTIVPLEWAYPAEATLCEVIYDDPKRVSCARVIEAIERLLAAARKPPFTPAAGEPSY